VTCARCRGKLPEHFETTILEVSRHLRDCPACRAEYATLHQALALLEREPCPPVPALQPGLWAKIEAAQRRPAVAVWERPLGLAMAALFIGFLTHSVLACWPVLTGWLASWPAWPSAAGLAAVVNSQLTTALDSLQSGSAGTLAVWQARPLPHAAWLALTAAAGWLVLEWTARRDTARLTDPEGVR